MHRVQPPGQGGRRGGRHAREVPAARTIKLEDPPTPLKTTVMFVVKNLFS